MTAFECLKETLSVQFRERFASILISLEDPAIIETENSNIGHSILLHHIYHYVYHYWKCSLKGYKSDKRTTDDFTNLKAFFVQLLAKNPLMAIQLLIDFYGHSKRVLKQFEHAGLIALFHQCLNGFDVQDSKNAKKLNDGKISHGRGTVFCGRGNILHGQHPGPISLGPLGSTGPIPLGPTNSNKIPDEFDREKLGDKIIDLLMTSLKQRTTSPESRTQNPRRGSAIPRGRGRGVPRPSTSNRNNNNN
jgi:hypothetical protein